MKFANGFLILLKKAAPLAALSALLFASSVTHAGPLPLEPGNGLTLHHSVGKASTLDAKPGLELAADPEVLRTVAPRRDELLAAMQARRAPHLDPRPSRACTPTP